MNIIITIAATLAIFAVAVGPLAVVTILEQRRARANERVACMRRHPAGSAVRA